MCAGALFALLYYPKFGSYLSAFNISTGSEGPSLQQRLIFMLALEHGVLFFKLALEAVGTHEIVLYKYMRAASLDGSGD